MEAIPATGDSILVPSEALPVGDSVWVQLRGVSYAEVRGIVRSIPVVRFVPPAPPPLPPMPNQGIRRFGPPDPRSSLRP